MSTKNVRFDYTGAVQTWTCPSFVKTNGVEISCMGAAGADGQGGGHPGGGGGRARASFGIAAGNVIQVYAGGMGNISGGGWGYITGGAGGSGSAISFGGGGGGSSAAYDETTSTLLAVGGGGGGGGSGGYGHVPGGGYWSQGGEGGLNQITNAGYPGYGTAGGIEGGEAGNTGAGGAAGSGGTAGTSAASGVAGAGGAGASAAGGSGGGGGGGYGAVSGGGGGGGGTGGGPMGGGGGAGGQSFLATTTVHNYFTDGENLNGVDLLGNVTGDGAVVISYTVVDFPLPALMFSPLPNASVDVWNDGITVSWGYQPGVDSGPNQYSYALRFQALMSSTVYWWDAATSTFTTTETYNVSAAESVTIPASKLHNSGPMVLSVNTTEDIYQREGLFAPDVLIITPNAPSVTITTPVGPTHRLPVTVDWTGSFISGQAQTDYRVVLYAASTTGAAGFVAGVTTALEDTGVVASTAETASLSYASFTTGDAYMVYVQLTQTDGNTTDFEPSMFLAQSVTPNAPAVVVSDPSGNGSTPFVLVCGGDTDDLVGNTTATVEKSTNGGGSWTTIGTLTLGTSQMAVQSDSAIVAGTIWRAQVLNGSNASAWTETPSVVTLGTTDASLSDPAIADSLQGVWIETFAAADRPISQGIFSGIGSSTETVISDVRRKREGTLTLITQSNAQRDVILAMLSTPRSLLLERPRNDPAAPGESLTFVVTGKVAEGKLSKMNRNQVQRTLEFTFVEQVT